MIACQQGLQGWIRLLLLTIALFVGQMLHAESFIVHSFHSDITLNQDGSFEVREDIWLRFDFPKHGFVRRIPFRYAPSPNVEGEIARGHQKGFEYTTPITNILVEGAAFQVSKTTNDFEVKIGSADIFVEGLQHYVITYKVEGAINFFSSGSELYWNVNGNGWETRFDSVSATVHLPKPHRLKPKDVDALTGAFGDNTVGIVNLKQPNALSFSGAGALQSRQGLTIIARFPPNFLTYTPVPLRTRVDAFVIDQLQAALQIHDDGTISVRETLDIEIVTINNDVVIHLPKTYPEAMEGFEGPRGLIYEFQNCLAIQTDGSTAPFPAFIETDDYAKAESAVLKLPFYYFKETGKYRFVVEYKIWGAVVQGAKGAACYLPLVDLLPLEALGAAHVTIGWEGGAVLSAAQLDFRPGFPQDAGFKFGPNQIDITVDRPLEVGESMRMALQIPSKTIRFARIPVRIYSPRIYFSSYHVDLEVAANGNLHVQERVGYFQSTFAEGFRRAINDHYDPSNNLGIRTGKPQIYAEKGHYVVQNMQSTAGDPIYYHLNAGGVFIGEQKPNPEGAVDTLGYSYDIFVPTRDSAGLRILEWPLIMPLDVPTENVSFSITLPVGTQLSQKDFLAWITPVKDIAFQQGIAIRFVDNIIYGELPGGLLPEQGLYFRAELPASAIHPSVLLILRSFLLNHPLTLVPVVALLLILFIWLVWGRDKPFTLVVQFYPPEGMTPAEAGVLIDDKLHNRDLLAMIYYWGATDLISIKESRTVFGDKTDFELTQLKPIPDTAHTFEKILFNALFQNGKVTSIGQHKQKFLTYMNQARFELNAYINRSKYYRFGSRGMATFMQVLGVIFGLIGAGSLAAMLGHVYVDDYFAFDVPIGMIVIGLSLLLFGRIMPSKRAHGQARYAELVGFREFILRADKAKLEELVNTNPDYFGIVLPYAIALGIATKWVDRFGDLLSAPPSYYKSASSSTDGFAIRPFGKLLYDQLDTMSESLNSPPPPVRSSRSYGRSSSGSSYSSRSSSSSSSSRSYSSSGSSGGSSSSSSSRSSGGGYGGGGGSSW